MNEPQRAHFLNEEQKQIKQQVMERLVDSFNYIFEKMDMNDHQALLDMITSVIVMFNREMLTITLIGFSLPEKDKLIDAIHEAIKKETLSKINSMSN